MVTTKRPKNRHKVISINLLMFLAISTPVSAQQITIHRKSLPDTGDRVYVNDIKDAPTWKLEYPNYFKLARKKPGWYQLNRYLNYYVSPLQHVHDGEIPGTATKNDIKYRFTGTLGYYFPHQAHITCSMAYCIDKCTEQSCPSPSGMKKLYSMVYYEYRQGKGNIKINAGYVSPGFSAGSYVGRRYLLTTSKEERDQLIKNTITAGGKAQSGWGCAVLTSNTEIHPDPTEIKANTCVLGFVY